LTIAVHDSGINFLWYLWFNPHKRITYGSKLYGPEGKFYYGPHPSLLAWESVLPGTVNISLNKQITLTILFENTMTHSIHLSWIRKLATIWSSVANFMKEQFPSLHQRVCYTYHEVGVLDPKVWCIIELHSYSASYTIKKLHSCQEG
jgi:hypothetical protein